MCEDREASSRCLGMTDMAAGHVERGRASALAGARGTRAGCLVVPGLAGVPGRELRGRFVATGLRGLLGRLRATGLGSRKVATAASGRGHGMLPALRGACDGGCRVLLAGAPPPRAQLRRRKVWHAAASSGYVTVTHTPELKTGVMCWGNFVANLITMCLLQNYVAAGYNNTELVKFLGNQQGVETIDLEANNMFASDWRDSSAYDSEEQFLRINKEQKYLHESKETGEPKQTVLSRSSCIV